MVLSPKILFYNRKDCNIVITTIDFHQEKNNEPNLKC